MRILTFDLFEATKGAGPKPLTKAQQEFLNRYTKGTWTWNPQTGAVDIDGDFKMINKGFKSFKGVRFGRVSGDFDCKENGLTSLEGAPKEVGGRFRCSHNILTSLLGAPEKVGGDFSCSENQLTSLEGAPEEIDGYFGCYKNKLTSLSGAPKEVGKGFDCSFNDLTSLEGAPEKVGGTFNCQRNQLTSLSGAPKEVGGDFYSFGNKLTSLVGAPKKIGGEFLSGPFNLKDWSIAGFLGLLNGNGKIRDLDATRELILQLLDSMPPEELYLSIIKRPDKNELLSRIRKEHPQLWDRIKGFGGRSSLSADMGDLFF